MEQESFDKQENDTIDQVIVMAKLNGHIDTYQKFNSTVIFNSDKKQTVISKMTAEHSPPHFKVRFKQGMGTVKMITYLDMDQALDDALEYISLKYQRQKKMKRILE